MGGVIGLEVKKIYFHFFVSHKYFVIGEHTK